MEAVHLVATFFLYFSLISITIGLVYKPWVVLWWHDRQNRALVLKYYGVAAVLLFIIKYLTA